MTRVTHRTIQESTLANLQVNLTAMSSLQEQLSTGRKINRPSDDPTGTVASLQLRQDIRTNEQHTRNAADAVTWLNTVDTALQTSSTQLMRARQLVLTGANSGAQGPDSRAALAIEVEGIKSALLGVANAKVGERTVFAGTAGSTVAVAQTGGAAPYTYTWADTGSGEVLRQVDGGSPVRVDVLGSSVFGANTTTTVAGSPAVTSGSVYALLDDVVANLRSGDTAALGENLRSLDGYLSKVSQTLSDVGARTNRVEQARSTADGQKVSLSSQLSSVEAIDLPETIVQLQMQEVAYKAALGATAKVLQPSLMDFLR